MERSKHLHRIYPLTILVLGFVYVKFSPFHVPCIWKKLFGIPCPGCGLTGAYISLLNFDIANAMRMNILSVPLLLLVLWLGVKFSFNIKLPFTVSKSTIFVISALFAILSEVYNIINYS